MKTLLTICCAIAIIFAGVMPAQGADCQAMLAKYKAKSGPSPLRRLKRIARCFEAKIKEDPNTVANYYGLAEAKYLHGKFYPALHQLDLARRHNPTKKELCDIEAMAIWLAPRSISSLQKMARVCRKVDPGKAEMARAFIKAKAERRRNMSQIRQQHIT